MSVLFSATLTIIPPFKGFVNYFFMFFCIFYITKALRCNVFTFGPYCKYYNVSAQKTPAVRENVRGSITLSLNCNGTAVTIPITPPSFLPILHGNLLNFSLTDSVYQDHMGILPCTYCSQYSHQSYSCVPVLLHQAMLLMVLGES